MSLCIKTGGKPDLFEYDEKEMLEIVANARCRDFLQTLLSFEHARRGEQVPRPAVVAAIEGRLFEKQWTMDELNALADHYENYAPLDPGQREIMDQIYRQQLNKG